MLAFLRSHRNVVTFTLRLLGPALLVYVLLRTDLLLVWQSLRAVRPLPLLLAVLLAAPFLVFKALRWRLVLRLWRVDLGLREASAATCVGQFLGTVTPGQSGDAMRAWYLHRRGVPFGVGLASVALDRACDLAVTLPLALWGLTTWWPSAAGEHGSIIWQLAALLLLALAALTVGWPPLRAAVLRAVPSGLRVRIAAHPAAAVQLHWADAAALLLATGVALGWTYLRIYLLCLALGLVLPLGPFVTMVALLALVGPLAPGGVGTRDALLVLALASMLQIERAAALPVALALSSLILALNLENVLIGAAVALRYPPGVLPAPSPAD